MAATEIIFEVSEDVIDGGYNAHALGYDIFTQGESLNDLRQMVRDAVVCYFPESAAPKLVRLRFVRDELIAV